MQNKLSRLGRILQTMKKNYLKYFAALLLFGSNGIVASNINIPSVYIVLYRTFLGSTLLLMLYLLTGNNFSFYKYKKDFFYICISGIAMGTSWMLLYEAYVQIGVSISSLLYYCGPVIVMILSPILFKEKLTVPKIIGFCFVLAGIFLVNGHTTESLNALGIVCGLLSAVMYSIMVMANKKSCYILNMENSLLQLITSFLTVAVFVICKKGFQTPTLSLNSILWLLTLGFLNTGIGCYLYFSSIGKLPVQSVAILGYIEPLSAVLFSVALLHEIMQPLQILGAVFIIGGAILSELISSQYT